MLRRPDPPAELLIQEHRYLGAAVLPTDFVPAGQYECIHHPSMGFGITMRAKELQMRRKNTWTTGRGEKLQLREMDLSHQLNALCLMSFSTIRMKKMALQCLIKPNASAETIGAFERVTPSDVYPIYEAMRETAYARFEKEYGVTLPLLKKEVYACWAHGTGLAPFMEDAARFYLRADEEPRKVAENRIMGYVHTLKPANDAEFRDMCWLMRIDQPKLWEEARNAPTPFVMSTLNKISFPSCTRNTALTLARSIPDVGDDVFGLDIPFYAGR